MQLTDILDQITSGKVHTSSVAVHGFVGKLRFVASLLRGSQGLHVGFVETPDQRDSQYHTFELSAEQYYAVEQTLQRLSYAAAEPVIGKFLSKFILDYHTLVQYTHTYTPQNVFEYPRLLHTILHAFRSGDSRITRGSDHLQLSQRNLSFVNISVTVRNAGPQPYGIIILTEVVGEMMCVDLTRSDCAYILDLYKDEPIQVHDKTPTYGR